MEVTEMLCVIVECTYLNTTELLLSWCNYKFMTTASKYPEKSHKKQFQFQFYNCHRNSTVVVDFNSTI